MKQPAWIYSYERAFVSTLTYTVYSILTISYRDFDMCVCVRMCVCVYTHSRSHTFVCVCIRVFARLYSWYRNKWRQNSVLSGSTWWSGDITCILDLLNFDVHCKLYLSFYENCLVYWNFRHGNGHLVCRLSLYLLLRKKLEILLINEINIRFDNTDYWRLWRYC